MTTSNAGAGLMTEPEKTADGMLSHAVPARGQLYTRTAIVLHWLIGVCVIAQIALGLWMIGIPKSPPGIRVAWFNLHKSIGITLALLILVRLLWRFAHRAPALPSTMPAWERIAARANHALLYACMIVIPVSGFLGSSFTKYPILYFGIKLPAWGWDSPALKDLFSQVHFVTVVIFISLIVIHITAAMKHWLIDRDGVAERMWFTPAPSPAIPLPEGEGRKA